MPEKDPIIICGGKPIPHTPTVKMRSALSAKVFRANGEVEDCGVISIKKVTVAFVTAICSAMANATYINTYKYHAGGTGTTAEANTQTALVAEIPIGSGIRPTGTQVAATNTYTSVATQTFAGSHAVTEHAVFNNADQATGGTMLDRSVFTAINVNSGDSIQYTYVLTINAES